MTKPGYEESEREAVERLDVLEDELPRGICSVRGCSQNARYAWAGAFGTRWLCSRHRPLYREHDRILARIRGL
jgi:hypothetical protein